MMDIDLFEPPRAQADDAWQFAEFVEVVQTGTDPELVDVNNRSGARYAPRAVIVATSARGEVRVWNDVPVRASAAADMLREAHEQACALTRRVRELGRLPVGFARWVVDRLSSSDADDLDPRERAFNNWQLGL
jgi:hypothetical protein